MNDSNLLTVAILTFDRADSLVRLLDRATEVSTPYPIVIFDDGDLGEKIVHKYTSLTEVSIEYRKSVGEKGYCHNYLRALTDIRSQYVLLMSDDDELLFESLPTLLKSALESTADFVSTPIRSQSNRWLRPSKKGIISEGEFLDFSRHAPGLLYNRDAVKGSCLEFLRSAVDSNNEFALVYPQVAVLSFLICSERRCMSLTTSIVRDVSTAQTGIRDSKGRNYQDLEARLEQLTGLLELLRMLGDQSGLAIEKMKVSALEHFLQVIILSVPKALRNRVMKRCRGSMLNFQLGKCVKWCRSVWANK